MPSAGHEIDVLAPVLAIVRLEGDAPVPAWALEAPPPVSIVRRRAELSVVCRAALVPAGVRCRSGWRALEIRGPLDLGLTGVLAAISSTLAAAGVAIFAISTYDTDLILIRSEAMEIARQALTRDGHRVYG